MNQPLTITAAVISMFMDLSIIDSAVPPAPVPVKKSPTIQVAILLDVSGSMQGLIEQAKGQLWSMVKTLGKVRCNEASVPIEIALYEYGRTTNDSKEGYVRQISGFTNDLDKLFNSLTILRTNGGEEYCGHVLYNSLSQLEWDTLSDSYKVIFIAGNESFLQGDISYTKACTEAKKKGVIINTIYCGDRETGVQENWNLNSECGNGSFMNIDHNAIEEIINTPYDSVLITLKERLNTTYIAYGEGGQQNLKDMERADTVAVYSLNDPTKIAQYFVVKGNSVLYNNFKWDLIDAKEKNRSIIDTLDMNTLVDSLRTKTRQQLKTIVEAKAAERASIQKQIADNGSKRDAYVIAEKKKKMVATVETLETAIERIIKEQVTRCKMTVQ